MDRLPLIALLAFVTAPILIGSAESTKSDEVKTETQEENKTEGRAVAAPKRKLSRECLASEEVISDLEAREKKLSEREAALNEREKDIVTQAQAVKDELAKLDSRQSEVQGVQQRELAKREEQVNKLIETFEGMSPKAAAQVMAGLDEDLAVMALGRLTSGKSGKILSNLKPEKSAKLSELMAYGRIQKRKESSRGESTERAPASAE